MSLPLAASYAPRTIVWIGAGALVTQRTIIPPRSLVMGLPAKVFRKLTPKEVRSLHDEPGDQGARHTGMGEAAARV